MKKFLPLFAPLLLASSSAIVLYVSMLNVTIFIPPGDVLLPTLVGSLLGLVLCALAYVLTRQVQPAGLAAAIFVLGLLYIWPLFATILGLLVVSVLLIRLVLHKSSFELANLALAAISVAASGYYLFQFFTFVSRDQATLQNARLVEPVFSVQDLPVPDQARPDIYFLILDGYGRADVLQNLHGFDNSVFLSALAERGFVVSGESRSNYPRTLLSLTSVLNMQYLDDLPAEMQQTNLWWLAMDTVHHSQARQYLEAAGYRTVFLASGFDLSDVRDGDVYLKPYPVMLKNFEAAYFSWTNLRFLGSFGWSGISFPSLDEARRVIEYDFEILPQAARQPGPKFVFAHIVAPHPPYLFDADGDPVDLSDLTAPFGSQVTPENVAAYRAAYLDQLMFVNGRILEAIDGILENSSEPPIIILQADHGPDVFMNFQDPDLACLNERYGILSAVLLPEEMRTQIPADLTPVNTFRFVFDALFDAGFDLLPNRQYYSTNDQPYLFRDVTAAVEEACLLPSSLLP